MTHRTARVPRIRSILPLLGAAVLSWAPPASAALFLNPEGGEVLRSNTVPNSDIIGFPLPYFNYFTTGAHQISYISTHGNIYYGHAPFLSETDETPVLLGSSGFNQISPLWQKLRLGANGSISVIEGPGVFPDYVAVTWQNMERADAVTAGLTGSFQAIIFQSLTTLNGIEFNRGDIVFSYHDVQWWAEGHEFIIGIQSQRSERSFAPGSGQDHNEGWYSPGTFGPNFPYAPNDYLLFQKNGTDYISSIQSIPEPSTFAALLGGAALLGLRARRRRVVR